MGGIELVRALGAGGIRSLVAGPGSERARLSRFAIPGAAPDGRPLVDMLLELARSLDEPPPLFTDSDDAVLLLSRERERLAGAFRFLMPHEELVLDLTDKVRFQRLAERLELSIPPGRVIDPSHTEAAEIGLRFPLVLKPAPFRDDRWHEQFGPGVKALRADDRRALDALWPRLASTGLRFMVQELVPGDETCIVSYHAYVDAEGQVAGEFTGRKIRTYPAEFGMSSALVTTRDPPLVRAGRDVIDRLELRGPGKVDFKRDANGALHLLEINARFTLWAQPGAVAGVNLPAIAYADLTGAPRPPVREARPGVRWIKPRNDLAAARAGGVPLRRWLRWALSCEANQSFAWNDPGPTLRRRLAR